MSIADLLTWIQNSALAHAISKSNPMVAAGLQVVHVLGFVTLLAALVLICLRVLNVLLREQPLANVVRDALRLLWLGFALVVVSGVLMFVATPKLYFYKPVFELKMLLFAAAVLIQLTLLRRAARGSASPLTSRVAVALSLLAWFGVGLAGRLIGFT